MRRGVRGRDGSRCSVQACRAVTESLTLGVREAHEGAASPPRCAYFARLRVCPFVEEPHEEAGSLLKL